MNHADIAEPLAAYALNAVDGEERVMLEQHLATCPRCRAELQEHREVATLLSHGGGNAPDAIWDRIAGALDKAPPQLRLAPIASSGPSEHRWSPPRYLMTAVAGVAAALMTVVGVQTYQQHQLVAQLDTALEDPLASVLDAALDDPGSQVLDLKSADGQLEMRGAVTSDGIGYLRASALPRLDVNRTYQLWGGAGDQLLSLGVLGPDPDIVSFQADRYATFAITEEAAPGAVTSANPPVAAGSFA
ncbi:MAG TPA: anti-sigma factor [Acidimicrobiales bacterium]|nr:anti-sigma factor [Acidimicrobiales bacterium]